MALHGFGALGLVAANAVNLSMRIAWSSWFIRRYFLVMRGWPLEEVKTELQLTKTLPRLGVWIVFAAAWMVTKLSERILGWDDLRAKAAHVGIGIAAFAIAATVT